MKWVSRKDAAQGGVLGFQRGDPRLQLVKIRARTRRALAPPLRAAVPEVFDIDIGNIMFDDQSLPSPREIHQWFQFSL